MHVEECCQALLHYVLPEIDQNRKGLCNVCKILSTYCRAKIVMFAEIKWMLRYKIGALRRGNATCCKKGETG